MAATQHLSKLNPNHPIHIQRKERSTTTTMPIEKARSEQNLQSAANDSPSGDLAHKIYAKPLRETIFGTTVLIVAGTYTILKLHSTLREDDVQSLSVLSKDKIYGLLWVRRAWWEAKGRYQTAKEWGREAIAVLLPFYLGAMVAVATLARIGWRIFMVKESENIC